MVGLLSRHYATPSGRQALIEKHRRPSTEPTIYPTGFSFDALPSLTSAEAAARRAQGQGNDVTLRTSRTLLRILYDNLFTLFNMVLLGLGILLLVLGEPRDAFFTTGIAIGNVLISVGQEVWARRRLDQIALLARPEVRVVRDGKVAVMDQGEVVVGDVLLVTSGDQIVVDGTVLGQGEMDVDESLLTGESRPVHKHDGDNVYSGSFCVSGQAAYVAERVGAESFANQLAVKARTFKSEYTPLQQEINLVIRILLIVVISLSVLLAVGYVLRGRPVVENARNASVIFGVAPSSLLLVIVLAYAAGSLRMVNRGALVQRINAVESLCHVDVICFDKTGTLTANRLRLTRVEPIDSRWSESDLQALLADYASSQRTRNYTTEAVSSVLSGETQPLLREVPFSSARGWSAVVFDDVRRPGAFILGAPDRLVDRLRGFEGTDRLLETWADEGLRVLLFAHYPHAEAFADDAAAPQLPSPLDPLCLLAFEEELRPETEKTLDRFEDAGVTLKIVSGDHPRTVSSLARQAGFPAPQTGLVSVSGDELEELDDETFALAVRDATIFGRIKPEQKELIVRALRDEGHYVAMTGDGVNDALALKESNLGIAMQSGSQATRHAADIVLLDDSFAALPHILVEGQRILHGMHDILRLYLTRILCLSLFVLSIGIIGIGFPFTPPQSAFISTVTLTVPSVLLGLWARPGPVPQGRLIRKLMHFVIPAVLSITVAGLFVYVYFLQRSAVPTASDIAYAQQALMDTVVGCGLVLLVFVEPPTEFWVGGDTFSGDRRPALLALGLGVLTVLAHAVEPVREFYGFMILQPEDYLLVGVVVVAWTFILRYIWRARLVERYLHVEFDDS